MKHIGLAIGDWQRSVAQEAQIPLLNRYYEQDPVPLDGQAALIARPGLRKWLTAGSGPIRGVFSQLGMFGNGLLVASGASLYKINPDETITTIGTGLAGSPGNYVPMCCTDSFAFIADGTNLWCYAPNGIASGILTITGAISAGETVQVGSVYYKFVAAGTGTVDAGIPAGTVGSPWLVSLSTSTPGALDNLAAAIENSGNPGVDYSQLLTSNTSVVVDAVASSTIKVRAALAGASGNSVATTETLANGSWGAAALTGGGTATFSAVPMPDNVGAVWCDMIAGTVIVVVAEGFDENGRFYWINPGDTTIDFLNFATAERAPDPLYSVTTLGDQFWLFGSSTTEVWYPTGDGDAPFQRIQGRLFDRGIWSGTAVKIGDEMIVIDGDAVAWKVSGAGTQRISTNGIEQRVREAMALELRA